MAKLKLFGIALNPYNQKEAYASVYYYDEKNAGEPLDQNNHKLHVNGEALSSEMVSHLKEKVMPIVQQALFETAYSVKEIGCEQGSAPFLVINNVLGSDIIEKDLKHIEKHINNHFEKIQQNQKPGLFSVPESKKESGSKTPKAAVCLDDILEDRKEAVQTKVSMKR